MIRNVGINQFNNQLAIRNNVREQPIAFGAIEKFNTEKEAQKALDKYKAKTPKNKQSYDLMTHSNPSRGAILVTGEKDMDRTAQYWSSDDYDKYATYTRQNNVILRCDSTPIEIIKKRADDFFDLIMQVFFKSR